MADVIKIPPSSKIPYVWAIVILSLIASLLIMVVLYLRPNSDPLAVMAETLKWLAPTIAGVLAYLKSQETHLSVNSRMDAWMEAQSRLSHGEGVIQGAAEEQARAAMVIHVEPIPGPQGEPGPPGEQGIQGDPGAKGGISIFPPKA